MLKRVLCILIVLILPCVALADYVMAGCDPEGTSRTWSSNQFFQRMEDRTGVKFVYNQYKKEEDWTQAKRQMKASDPSLPDVLFKVQLTPAECIDLLDRGVLIDLAPYLE